MTDSNYNHPQIFNHLRDLSNAMEYNAAGEPAIRTVPTTGVPSSTNATVTDAFGRSRVSNPFTIFDSQLRYTKREDQYVESLSVNATTTYNVNQSSLDLNVTNESGSRAVRETSRVFAYQPGKSLQVLTTFVMDQGQQGLAQRVGYFNDLNGIYFANIDGANYLCKRSYVTGSVQDTLIPQSEWNANKLDGSTTPGIVLDSTKAQIFFIDMEWLGVGQVRAGFVINGILYVCHVFQHANIADTTYMTTACLPVRFEIQNAAETVTSSTLKQICATVISEGGYQLNGTKHSITIPGTRDLTTANTDYPVLSIRLKSDRLDAISILKKVSITTIGGNSSIFRIKLVEGAQITGGTWVTSINSSVEYNANATSLSGGVTLNSAVTSTTNQVRDNINLDGGTFAYQLQRNGLTNTATTITIVANSTAAGDDIVIGIDWEDIV